MTGSEKDDKGPRAPYEPPKLFDLGGGVAHAASPGPCGAGGSPAEQCNSGTTATYSFCQMGFQALGRCKAGKSVT